MIQFAMQRVSKGIALLPIMGMVLSLICFPLVTQDEPSTVSRDLACVAADPDDPESALEHKGTVSIPSFVTSHLSEINPFFGHNSDLSLGVVVPCLRPLVLRC
jgi:hypothetical protein